jgi:hypothetical protein
MCDFYDRHTCKTAGMQNRMALQTERPYRVIRDSGHCFFSKLTTGTSHPAPSCDSVPRRDLLGRWRNSKEQLGGLPRGTRVLMRHSLSDGSPVRRPNSPAPKFSLLSALMGQGSGKDLARIQSIKSGLTRGRPTGGTNRLRLLASTVLSLTGSATLRASAARVVPVRKSNRLVPMPLSGRPTPLTPRLVRATDPN